MNEFVRLFARSGLSLERLHSFLEVAEAGNIAKAAGSDPTRQSQFSRQVKELEGYFGLALTRRVGRRIEITDDGRRLATMIRQQFLDLDSFRESAAGRTVTLRIGASGSVIQWMLAPRLGSCRDALGGATLDVVQSRSAEVVRGVADGRFDFGIVRRDAVPARRTTETLPLVTVGYSLFVPANLIPKRSRAGAARLLATLPVVMLMPGGRFQSSLDQWLAEQEIHPNVIAHLTSFLAAAAMVEAGQAAAVLPDLAASVLHGQSVTTKSLPWDHRRELAMIWNTRGLDRAGFGMREVKNLEKALKGSAKAG